MQYVSTFPAGFEKIIDRYMTTNKRGDYTIDNIEPGFVLYTSNISQSKVLHRPVFTNTFSVVAKLGKMSSLNQIATKISGSLRQIRPVEDGKTTTFKLLVLNENTPTAIADNDKVRSMLAKQLKLRHVSHHPDCEVIILRRHNSQAYILLRPDSYIPQYSKNQKGALSESTASLLCVTSKLQKNETVLDPFAGYGAIPFACATYFQPKKVIALEKDPLLANQLRSLLPEKCRAYKQDVMTLRAENKLFRPHTIDRIITDPPWGQHDTATNIAAVYQSLARLSDTALRKYGVVTVLTSQPSILEESFRSYRMFSKKQSLSVLISGKKATVVTFQKS